MIHQQIGNYKFLSLLGEGGMAKVYLAENTMLRNKVAIKVLKEEHVHNKNIRTRFLDEARKMVKVMHPNIILVLDLIDMGDIVAIVMEYVEGESLKDLIKREGKLDDKSIETLLSQMLTALKYIHQFGFVHRDIKPSNFLLSKLGTIKLADFGIAKDLNDFSQTTTNTQMGTPMYMSPEQIKCTRDVDQCSDIYSLGVVLYEMVTGTNPYLYQQLSLFELQLKITSEPLPPSQTFWDQKIQKATSKDINNRYQSCEEWLAELKQVKMDDATLPEIETPTIIQSKPDSNKVVEIKSVLINNQRWMSENLNVDTFRNGDLIPEARTNDEWIKFGEKEKPAWCYFDNDPENEEKFGRLYNWFAVNDPRGLAPKGWHVPSDSEWTRLKKFIDGTSTIPFFFNKKSIAGKKLKSREKWNGTDDFEFCALPSGGRFFDGEFVKSDYAAFWWTSTTRISNYAYLRSIFSSQANLNKDKYSKRQGYSVRCIKDLSKK